MNILYCVPFWPYLYTPWLFREVAWMRRRGHHVAIVSLNDPSGPKADLAQFGLADVPTLQVRRPYPGDGALIGEVLGLGLGMVTGRADLSLAEYRRTRGVRQGLHEWAVVKRVARFARSQGAQIIDAQWASEGAELASKVKRATGLPYTVTMQGGDLYRSPSPVLPSIVANADAVCPVSRYMADLLLGKVAPPQGVKIPRCTFDESKLWIRFNSVPSDILPDDPVTQRDDIVLVGTIGRADPEKRHADLIDAVADLAPTYPALRLRIIGGGQLENDLKARIKARGVEDKVEITGSRDGAAVLELAKDLHIYVQAAEVEGCSFATLEATGQGMPLIATRTGAYQDVVDADGELHNGFTYDAGDVATLREHLRKLVADRVLRETLGRASLRIVRERFSSDVRWTKVERLYEAIVAGKALPE